MGIKDWFGRFRKRKAVPAEEIIEETTVEETVAGSEDPAAAFGASETDGTYGDEPFDAESPETAEVFEADEIIAAEPLPRLTIASSATWSRSLAISCPPAISS